MTRPGARREFSLALAAVVGFAGCQLDDDVVARRLSDAGGADTAGGRAGEGDAGGGAGAGCGADVTIIAPAGGQTAARACAGWAARRSFSYAVCACEEVSVRGVLATEALAPTPGTGARRGGAAVGINGSAGTADYLNVDGSLTIFGAGPTTWPGGLDVEGDLRLAGATQAVGPIFVARDAWLLAETSSLSLVTIDRDLHLADGASLGSLGPVTVGGSTLEGSFELAAPCACAEDDRLEIETIVADGLLRNDNARVGLDPSSSLSGPLELELSCGRFAVRSISGGARIRLLISGAVVLVVDGDVEAGPEFRIDLGPAGELDWFVRGNLSLSAGARIGSPERTGATRLYVQGAADIGLPGTSDVALNLYAPASAVTIGGLGEIYGALFARRIESAGPLLAHYDGSVLEADRGCALPAPSSCTGCDQCGARGTCVAGVCGACTRDADCCSPLMCEAGTCRALTAD